MFTGIIEQTGTIKTISSNKLEIAADFTNVEIGESIAINALRGGFSPETVATITCLEIDEIRRIAEELN